MEELLGASELLRSALSKYMAACSDVTESYNPWNGNSPESLVVVNCIIREIQTTASYEAKIQTARSILVRCRNSCPSIVPIHSLPSDVLAHIFTLIYADSDYTVHNERGMFDQRDYQVSNLKLPLILSHVCSRWRQIAVSSRRLWSNIDITASSPRCAKLLFQAELFSTRAELMPLNLHVFSPRREGVLESPQPISRQLSKACALLAPRTRSYRLDNLDHDGKGLSYLLYYFLREADSKNLRELRLLDHGGSGSTGLLVPKDASDQYNPRTWPRLERLWLSTRAVDQRLLSVEVLWLRNVFSPWSCHVYIGLTDLRLIADHGNSIVTSIGPHILMKQLAGVLLSCPGLRIFHCNLCVDVNDGQPPIPPIPLRQLEAMNLHRMAAKQSSQLLAYIFPGENPLELSLFVRDEREVSPERFLPELVLDFFSRSRVTRLFLHKEVVAEKYDDKLFKVSLAKLLSELPGGLCTLGLNRFQVYHGAEEPRSWPTKLNAVYIRSWNVDVFALQKLATICSLDKLMLSHLPVRSREKTFFTEEVAKLISTVNSSWNPPERWKE